MSGKGSVDPSGVLEGPPSGSAGVDDGAGARTSMTGRGGAMVMRSVSIFLANGRKASVASKRVQPSLSSPVAPVSHRRRRKMPDEASAAKNAAMTVKILDSLKKKTKFSR